MNNINLIILPGGGNPDTEYKPVYDLLEEGAIKYGYTHIDRSLRWPGHFQPNNTISANSLTLDGALEKAKEKLNTYERKKICYDLLGRSFGCLVALRYAMLRPRLLKKIILYGLVPYWRIWEEFARDIGASGKKARERGLLIDNTYFPTVVPIESMLPFIQFSTVLIFGEKDEYINTPYGHTTKDYMDYLRKIVGSKSNFCFRIVPEAIHTITRANSSKIVVESYLYMLYN